MSRSPLLAILAALLLPIGVAGCDKTPRPKTIGADGVVEFCTPLDAPSAKRIAARAPGDFLA